MGRLYSFLAGLFRGLLNHSAIRLAATHFSTRAALTALGFFLLATAGIHQMDVAYRKSIVKEGRYSVAETRERRWLAPDLRVGWKKKEAYVGLADYAVLASLDVGGDATWVAAFALPLAWFAASQLRRGQMQSETTPAGNGVEPRADWVLERPLAEG